MRYLNKIILYLGMALLFSGLFVQYGFTASAFNIGVINDCRTTLRNQIFEDIKKEVYSLTKGEFNVQFPAKFNIVSDCSKKELKKNIGQLLSNPDVDMILTWGPLSSHLLAQYKNYSKPCIAGYILNPELQGLPIKKNKSGKHNLTYVSSSTDIKGNIEQFKEIATFKTAALLYDAVLAGTIDPENTFLKQLQKEMGLKFVLIPVGSQVKPVIDSLDDTIEAIFLADLTQLNEKELSSLISYLNNNKKLSFTFHNRALVEKGLLAGFDRTSDKQRFSRRIALLTQRILLKEDPKDFKVAFEREENLVINIQTAKKLDISPSFSIQAKAELIKNEMPKGDTQRKEIALSSLVAGESRELDKKSLGLDETTKSLSLLDAINRALDNNLILKSKVKETEAGKMNVKLALSNFYPQLSTGVKGTMIDDDHTSAISGVAEKSWDISAQVSQLIYSDQIYTNLKTSKHLQKVQELSENQERLDIILETGIAYINMLKSRANTKIQHENLKLIRSNLKLANNRYKAGLSSPSDVYRLESEAAIAYSNYLDTLVMVGQTRIKFNQILNFDLEAGTTIQDIRLDDDLFIFSDPQMRSVLKIDNPKDFKRFRDFMVAKGLETSPEIEALNEHIMIQTVLYDTAKRSYWSPNVSVNGNIGNTFSESGDGSDFNPAALPGSLSSVFKEPEDNHWAISLNLEIPFYEGGAKSASKRKALETGSQLKFFKYDVQNKISENIRTALLDLSASYPSIELTRVSANAARKNLDLILDAYSKGAVSIVHFLDAQNAAMVASTSAENAVYDFFIDLIISERASGKYTILMDQGERHKWIQEFLK